MASFSEFKVELIPNFIERFLTSNKRRKLIEYNDYYNGENTTITNIMRTYYSDAHKGMIENPFVANNKIAYDVFHDIVSQKVNTLLNETPTIDNIEVKNLKGLGYALKNLGIKASICGYSFAYVGKENVTVFDTENCIPFYDDETQKIKVLIRFWKVENEFNSNDNTVYFVETYEEDGKTVYKMIDNKLFLYREKEPYLYNKVYDVDNEFIESFNIGLPIVMLKNNDDLKSDLKFSLKSKIDAIDIVSSGLMNNIDDFSDMFWIIKDKMGYCNDALEDFVANINKTKKMILNGDDLDVETKTQEIPYQARQSFVEQLKKEIIEESGILDTATLTGSSLTTTAIEAATLKLQQRVSDFEWDVYLTTCEIIEFYKKYNNINEDYEISFNKLFIKNQTEMIDNAIKLTNIISQRDVLKLIKQAGYIDNVDETLKEIQEEQQYNLDIKEEETQEDI